MVVLKGRITTRWSRRRRDVFPNDEATSRRGSARTLGRRGATAKASPTAACWSVRRAAAYDRGMGRTFTDLWKDASELSAKARADLAGLLIESLEGEPDEGVEAAWAAEIGRRVAELETGTVKSVPWEAVRQRLLDRLDER